MAKPAPVKRKAKPVKEPRSKFAPLPADLSDEALLKMLSNRGGIQRLVAELYSRFRKGGTALELEFMTRELRVLTHLERAIDRAEDERADHDLSENLAAVLRLMEGKKGSALRADMAPSPPAKASKRTLQ